MTHYRFRINNPFDPENNGSAAVRAKGLTVVIPKGTVIRTTHPSDGPIKVAKRNHTVKVHHVNWGYIGRDARDKAEQNIVSGNQVLTEDRVKHRDTALAAMNLALDPSSGDYEVGTALAHSLKALDRAGLPLPPSKLKKLESNELVARAMRALPAGNG